MLKKFFFFFIMCICFLKASSGTDGGHPGSSDAGPFKEMSPLRLPLLPKQFYKL